MTAATMGSLFDGAGGFPYAGTLAGIEPIWASEIEPLPVLVTSRRFPRMRHLGDIRKIRGAAIEPVDIVTFGSPCQDLSVAGKRAGLGGERSGLFGEAMRIIREMREATDGRGATFIVWENVPGAFSSNGGEDFRRVLEEVAGVAEPGVHVPRPDGGKWADAGEIVGDGYSVAWRVLDAQFWGVPQRRRRIYLVADFGGGRAGEVLFEREGVPGDTAAGGGEGQGAAGGAASGSGCAGGGVTWARSVGNGQADSLGLHDVANTLDCYRLAWTARERAGHRSHSSHVHDQQAVMVESGIGRTCMNPWDTQQSRVTPMAGQSPTLAGADGGGGRNPGGLVLAGATVYESHPQDSRVARCAGAAPTVAAKYGTGGNSTPLVASVDCRNLKETEGMSGTLQAHPQGGYSLNFTNPVRYGCVVRRLMPIECCRLQGFPDWWMDGLETPDPTEGELDWWAEAFEEHRLATAPGSRPKARSQIKKWLANPRSDSAEYKMWGNSLAVPVAYSVLNGIAGALADEGGL